MADKIKIKLGVLLSEQFQGAIYHLGNVQMPNNPKDSYAINKTIQGVRVEIASYDSMRMAAINKYMVGAGMEKENDPEAKKDFILEIQGIVANELELFLDHTVAVPLSSNFGKDCLTGSEMGLLEELGVAKFVTD